MVIEHSELHIMVSSKPEYSRLTKFQAALLNSDKCSVKLVNGVTTLVLIGLSIYKNVSEYKQWAEKMGYNSLSSFIRQLNMYNFLKVRGGIDGHMAFQQTATTWTIKDLERKNARKGAGGVRKRRLPRKRMILNRDKKARALKQAIHQEQQQQDRNKPGALPAALMKVKPEPSDDPLASYTICQCPVNDQFEQPVRILAVTTTRQSTTTCDPWLSLWAAQKATQVPKALVHFSTAPNTPKFVEPLPPLFSM